MSGGRRRGRLGNSLRDGGGENGRSHIGVGLARPRSSRGEFLGAEKEDREDRAQEGSKRLKNVPSYPPPYKVASEPEKRNVGVVRDPAA